MSGHTWGKDDGIVTAAIETYLLSSVKQILHFGLITHDDIDNTFERMSSISNLKLLVW